MPPSPQATPWALWVRRPASRLRSDLACFGTSKVGYRDDMTCMSVPKSDFLGYTYCEVPASKVPKCKLQVVSTNGQEFEHIQVLWFPLYLLLSGNMFQLSSWCQMFLVCLHL